MHYYSDSRSTAGCSADLPPASGKISLFAAVLGIRIRRIRMFLGLPDPDPLVGGTGMDPDPVSSFFS